MLGATSHVTRLRERPPDGGLILGAEVEAVAVRRYRRPAGTITPAVGGDGRIHVTVSLMPGPIVEKVVERGATRRRVLVGDVSIDYPDVASLYVVQGASDVVQIMLDPEDTALCAQGPRPVLTEPEPGLETLAYRVAQAIWLGEAEDPLFLSSVSVSARELLGRRAIPSRGGLSARNARLVVELIDARVADPGGGPVTLATLAAATGLSVYHLVRAFRQSFGTTPYRFATRRRLGLARDLLAGGATDLRDICGRTGFSSVPHLTAAFGREMGVPPARFRRMLSGVRRGY